MLIGDRRVSSSNQRQVVYLQLDPSLAAGVDERHLHQDKQSGGRDDRAGRRLASPGCEQVMCWWSGSSTASAARCRTSFASWRT